MKPPKLRQTDQRRGVNDGEGVVSQVQSPEAAQVVKNTNGQVGKADVSQVQGFKTRQVRKITDPQRWDGPTGEVEGRDPIQGAHGNRRSVGDSAAYRSDNYLLNRLRAAGYIDHCLGAYGAVVCHRLVRELQSVNASGALQSTRQSRHLNMNVAAKVHCAPGEDGVVGQGEHLPRRRRLGQHQRDRSAADHHGGYRRCLTTAAGQGQGVIVGTRDFEHIQILAIGEYQGFTIRRNNHRITPRQGRNLGRRLLGRDEAQRNQQQGKGQPTPGRLWGCRGRLWGGCPPHPPLRRGKTSCFQRRSAHPCARGHGEAGRHRYGGV